MTRPNETEMLPKHNKQWQLELEYEFFRNE